MLLSMNNFKLFGLQCLRESQVTTKRTFNQPVSLLQCVPFYLCRISFIKLTHKRLS